MRKSIYNLATVAGVALLALSCNQNELESPSSLVRLSLDVVSDIPSVETRSSETVFEHQISEGLWLAAHVSDNPVSLDEIPTRGTITTSGSFVSLYGGSGFGVYAEEKNNTANVLFDNETFTYSTQDMTWAPSEPEKWPLFATEWYCFAPDSIAELSASDKTFDYATPSVNGASGEDILVAHIPSVPAKRATPLAIAFDHALCAVKFKSDVSMPAGTVTSLSIDGICMEGTYDFTTDSWGGQANPGTISLSTSVTVSGTAGTPLTSGSQTFFVMPQTLGDGASVSLTFEGEGYTIPLPSGFEFRAGEIITFTLGPKEISVIKAFPLDENFGSVSVSPAGPYAEGDVITLTATPEQGCHLAYWVDENGRVYKDSYGDPIQANNFSVTLSRKDSYLAVFETNPGVDFCVGSFTVSDYPKVVTFSQGNLWASIEDEVGTVTSWNFESAQQYNRHFNSIRNDSSRLYYNIDETPVGTVGSFFWTDDYSRASSRTFNDSDWTPDQTFFASNSAIRPGWRVLSSDEWEYLLNTRTVQGGTGKDHSYRLVSVAGMKGLLIYPDNYSETLIPNPGVNYYPIDFIPEGCVFLSLAGIRSGDGTRGCSNYEQYGMYWSTTPDTETYEGNHSYRYAYLLDIHFNASSRPYSAFMQNTWAHDARSIRMVKQTFPPMTDDNSPVDNNVSVEDPDTTVLNIKWE